MPIGRHETALRLDTTTFLVRLMSGYFLVYRGLHDKPLFRSNQPFSRFEAWLDAIELANFTDSVFRHNSTMLPIPRGAIGTSHRSLAKRWHWSVDRVIRELKLWSGQGMVELETRQGYLHITISNYDQYQSPHDTDATPSRQPRDTDATRTSTNQKKEKKVIQEKNEEPPTPYPDWLPVDLFLAFEEMRKGKRKPLTKLAKQLAIDELDNLRQRGHDPKAVLKQSILHSWDGLFPIKANNMKGPTHGSHTGFDKQDYRAGTEGFDVT